MGAIPAPDANSFGKYTLVAKLATGGMAEIFLARLSGAAGFEKLVCVKRILPHLAKDQNLVGMFLAEAKIAAQISHHNVCQVFELGEIDHRYFIAMEYLEGVPFSCFRRRDMYPPPPDPRLVAGLGVQACEGLHHAHQLKRADGSSLEVVHRDVSSNNLFATTDGIVKVLDFGIAKVQDASVRTSTGSVKGTYAYMAPEQLRGEQLDRRTDVFAIGIVLWELFARKHLFKRETDFLTFQAITQDPIPDVSEFRPDVPPQLADAIARALSRNREDRFPSARAMAEELARSVAPLGGPMSASEISDVIAEAFRDRLKDQRALIRIAREGGALDLDDDLGPGIGHGTSMSTTPVSSLLAAQVDVVPPVASSSAAMAAIAARRASQMETPPVFESITPAPAPRRPTSVPPNPRSTTAPAALPAAPVARRSKLPLIVLVASLLLIGGAVALYFVLFSSKDRAKEIAGTDPGSQVQVAVTIPDASPAKPAIDAPEPTYNPRPEPPADAAPAIVADAAVVTPDAAPTQNDSTPPRPPKKDPPAKGPPGFITIDSSPIYAVIYIDGRSYGETPLPRIQLAPGRHVVRAVSASGVVQNAVIHIEPGKLAPTYRFKW
jgi:serine/threonine-protein kinase